MGDEKGSQTPAPPQRAMFSRQPPRGNAGTSGGKVSGVGRPEGWSLASVAGKPSIAHVEGQQEVAKLLPVLQTPKSAEGTGHSLQANSRAGPNPASAAPAQSGATSERLARLAQQRQRLAEQRARLAAGRSVSSQLKGHPPPAAASAPAERPAPLAQPPATVGRHPSASTGEAPLPKPNDGFTGRTMQRAADAKCSNGSQTSGKSLALPSGQLPQDGLHSKPAAHGGVKATRETPPGILEEHVEGPKGTEAAVSIPFGLASSRGSGGDFFRGAGESSGAKDASETHGASSDSHHGDAPAEIPFGGASERPDREPDAAFGAEQDTSQLYGSRARPGSAPSEPSTSQASTEGRRGGAFSGAFSAGQEPQLNGGPPVNGVYDNSSSCQASEEWSHKPHWGSGSSLSTHPPPPQQAPRLGHHSRNPSWASSEHMSSSSAAAPPQPPMSQPVAPAWDAHSHPPPWQSHAPRPGGHWDDAVDDGADFFASSPMAPRQEPGGTVGDGLRPQQGQAGGSGAESKAGNGIETEPAPEPLLSSAETQGREQPSPFAAGSVQQLEFPWEGPQMHPDHHAAVQSGDQWGNQGAAGHSAAWGYREPHSHGWGSSGAANGHGGHEIEEPSFGGRGEGDTYPSYGLTASEPAWAGQPGGYGHQWQGTAQSYGAHAWQAQVQANASELPRTAEHASRCPSGRPPIPLIAFGFGGRVVAMRPRPSPVMSSAGELALGQLELLRTDGLAAALGRAQPSDLDGGVSSDHDPQLLRSFPGVLSSSTPKTKVLQFVAEREARAGEEEGSTETEAASLKLLWAVIRLLIQNKGSLKSAPEGGGRGKAAQTSVEKQLAELLEEGRGYGEGQTAHGFGSGPEQGSWAQGRALLEQSTGGSAAAEDAARRMQDLLQQGEQAAALKVAIDAQLWGPALLLAKLSGGSAFDETAGAMTSTYLRPGTPLQALLSTAAAQPAVQQHQQPGDASAEEVHRWRACLAILALNSRGPSGEAAVLQLGDRLSSDNVLAAHVCYLVAGVVPLAYDPAARLCLPGADHRRQPRVFASVAAIQRGLLLEWARLQVGVYPKFLSTCAYLDPTALATTFAGHGPNPQSAAAMLPYRLILAARLAEYGRVDAASQETAGVTAALNGLGGRLPGGLLVVRSLANELQLRLQTHAQAFNINISRAAGGSLMTKAGKWLDKSLSKLIGVGELPEGAQPPEGRPQQPHQRPRSSSQPGSPKAQTHRRVSSAVDMGGTALRPQTPQNLPNPSALASAEASPQPSTTAQPAGAERASSLSVRGLIGKVGSFTSLLGATAAPNKREAELGSENSLYYDNELKMWREPGKPPPEPQAPQPPPPTFTASLAPPPGGRTERGPAGPPQEAQCLVAQASGVRSRYVDTIASSNRQPSSTALPKPSGIIPRPAFFTPAGAARPAVPNFFTPAGGGQNPAAGQQGWVRQPSVESAPSAEQLYVGAAVQHPWGPPSGSSSMMQRVESSQEALEEMTEVAL